MLSVGSSRKLTLELFPFISLFLCVIGVLAFLQNLLVMGDIGASEEDAKQPQIFQVPYKIDCLVDRIVLHPPETELLALYEKLTIDELAAIESIQSQRTNVSTASDQAMKGTTLTFAPEFNETQLRVSLNEIATLNRLAKEHGIAHEEYVLLNVHSGGSDAYHYLIKMLDQPEYTHIRTGLDISGTDSSNGITNNQADFGQ